MKKKLSVLLAIMYFLSAYLNIPSFAEPAQRHTIDTEYGRFSFTLDRVRRQDNDNWNSWARIISQDAVLISICGIIENDSFSFAGAGELYDSFVAMNMEVTDQNGIKLDLFPVYGLNDEIYESCPTVAKGQKVKAAYPYAADKNVSEITIKFSNGDAVRVNLANEDIVAIAEGTSASLSSASMELGLPEDFTPMSVPGGVYKVGEDIPAGLYTVKAEAGSANLTTWGYKNQDYDTNGGLLHNIVLDAEDNQIMGRLPLEDGQEIAFTGELWFEPYVGISFDWDYQNDIPAGEYKVGKDIPAGKYRITVREGNANLSVWGSRFQNYNKDGGLLLSYILDAATNPELGKVTLDDGNVLVIYGPAMIETFEGIGKNKPTLTPTPAQTQTPTPISTPTLTPTPTPTPSPTLVSVQIEDKKEEQGSSSAETNKKSYNPAFVPEKLIEAYNKSIEPIFGKLLDLNNDSDILQEIKETAEVSFYKCEGETSVYANQSETIFIFFGGIDQNKPAANMHFYASIKDNNALKNLPELAFVYAVSSLDNSTSFEQFGGWVNDAENESLYKSNSFDALYTLKDNDYISLLLVNNQEKGQQEDSELSSTEVPTAEPFQEELVACARVARSKINESLDSTTRRYVNYDSFAVYLEDDNALVYVELSLYFLGYYKGLSYVVQMHKTNNSYVVDNEVPADSDRVQEIIDSYSSRFIHVEPYLLDEPEVIAMPEVTATPTPTPTPTATPTPTPTEEPTPTVKQTESPINQSFVGVKAGDIIQMGYYEQDNNLDNLREAIKWEVLTVNKKNEALIISLYGLDGVSYGKPMDTDEYMKTGVNWETSYLREWLNNTFYSEAFSESEKSRIIRTQLKTQDKAGTCTTDDNVFVLSGKDVSKYFKKSVDAACQITKYSKNKLKESQGAVLDNGYGLWWLREMVSVAKIDKNGNFMQNTGNQAAYVFGDMGNKTYKQGKGAPVFCDYLVAVRPAMWIQTEAAPKPTKKPTPTPKPKPTKKPTPSPKPKATKKPSSSSKYLSDSELIELAKGYFVLKGGNYESISDASIEHNGNTSYVYLAVNFHCYVVKINRKTGVGLSLQKLF